MLMSLRRTTLSKTLPIPAQKSLDQHLTKSWSILLPQSHSWKILVGCATSKREKTHICILTYIAMSRTNFVHFEFVSSLYSKKYNPYYTKLNVIYPANCTGSKLSQCSAIIFFMRMSHRIRQYQLKKNL